jgi:hypothetical protein
MTDDVEISRRAYGLLRWYPLAWRERYGAEFVDLMEQEFVENPRSLKRTSNIVYKGIVARLRELGLVASPLNSNDQSRSATSTVCVVAVVYVALALSFWSVAMLDWNYDWRNPASTSVTIWTGAVTVLAGIVAVLVLANLFALLWSATRRAVKGQSAAIRVPLSLILATMTFLILAMRGSIRFAVTRGGSVWYHPGQAIKQIAGMVQATATNVLWIWMNLHQSLTVGTNVVYALIPIALVVLAFSVATLIRRTEFSASATRFVQYELFVVAATMVLFVIAYFGLIASGNEVLRSPFGQQLSYPPLEIEFGVMTLMAVIGIQAANRLLRNRALHSQG